MMAASVARVVACALIMLAVADAQCTLPAAEPAGTQFVPGTPECAVDGEIEEDFTCTIQCLVGLAQGDTGTFDYVCGADGELAEPAPVCTPCDVGTFNPTAGSLSCADCPLMSTTLAVGADAVTDCECVEGHTGIILDPDSECTECDENTFKAQLGPALCIACPENSNTEGTGATAASACIWCVPISQLAPLP